MYCPYGISPMGNSGCLLWGKPAVTESCYPTYSTCWMFLCFHNPSNSGMDYGIFNVRTDVNACNYTWRCTDTEGESALKVDSRRKIPCRTRESNLRQWHAGLMLYQLSYLPTQQSYNNNKTSTSSERPPVLYHQFCGGCFLHAYTVVSSLSKAFKRWQLIPPPLTSKAVSSFGHISARPDINIVSSAGCQWSWFLWRSVVSCSWIPW